MAPEHGLSLKREHFPHLLEHDPDGVDAFEIIAENFFGDGGRPWAVLGRLRERVPVSVHGTAMGLGDAAGVAPDYLDRLERLVRRLEPARISDHLCFVGAAGTTTHELLPLPHTEEAVFHVAGQISRVQDRLRRRIAVENVSTYVRFEGADLDEADFVAAVVERADCNLLLDLNNVLVNARNHGLDPLDYVERMPASRVEAYHLAGAEPVDGLLLDTHLGPVPGEVWDLYRFALRRIGPRPTVVEWDTDVPDFATVAAECRRAREIERAHGGGDVRAA
jgi:hypothetical protein